MGELVAERYELQRLLGRGGMSEVWLARDRELDRPVAVKLHAPGADPARFVREAKAAAQLSHPNIATVYDFGTAAQGLFLVVEYLPERTLEDRLVPDTPLPDDQTERIARDVAEGLAHAHAGGVVHRDLKPSNVLFDAEGRAKITDFGIARALDESTLTEAGTVLGTAGYIAPEQAAGEPVGPSSDVYSFGVILYRLLTGRLPFEGASAVEVAVKHQTELPPAVDSYRPDVPGRLALLAEAALAKDPGARPQTGADLVAALAGTAAAAPPAPDSTADTLVLRPYRAFPSTRLVGAGLGAVAVFVVGALAAVFVSGSPGSKQSPGESRSHSSGKGPALATTRSTSAATTTAESRTASTPTTSHTTTRRIQTRRSTTAGLGTTAPATTEETTAPATTETTATTSGATTAP